MRKDDDLFTLHAPQSPSFMRRVDQFVAIPYGFRWDAFAFGPLWLAARGLWMQALAHAVFQAAIAAAAATGWIAPLAGWLALGLAAWFVGLEANEWLRARAERKGCALVDIRVAAGPVQAEAAALRAMGEARGPWERFS